MTEYGKIHLNPKTHRQCSELAYRQCIKCDWIDTPDTQMPECRRQLVAMVKYCKDAPTHSALSTAAMLAIGALEAYDAERMAYENSILQLFGKLNVKVNEELKRG